MAKFFLQGTPSSVVFNVKILDSTATDGRGLTGLVFNSAGLIISTIKIGEATPTIYSQAGNTIETIATIGTYVIPAATKCRFKEIDPTNHPGVYQIMIADARYASTTQLLVSIHGAADAAENEAEFQIGTVTVGTNNDKTGYDLNNDQSGVTVGTVNAATVSGTVTTDSASRTASKADVTNLDVAVSSRSVLAAGAKMDLIDAPNASAITAIQSGLALAATLAQVKGAIAGRMDINAAGTQIKKYDVAGNLLVTLNRSATAPFIWTPTWA